MHPRRKTVLLHSIQVCLLKNILNFQDRWVSPTGGTGMIASSSTFCPHPGRVIRGESGESQLHAVWHGTEALVYSSYPKEAAASSYLPIIFGRIASGIPWLLRSTAVPMQLSHQCWRWCRPWWP